MPKYRKLPVVIEAYQTDVPLDIPTLEGIMHASSGDWIITGVNGEQYPCKPDIFAKTYEPADAKPDPLTRLADAAERIAAELEWMRRQREPQPSRPPAKARPGAPVLFHKGGGGIVITHEFLTDHWEYLIRAYGEDTAHTFLEDEFELDGLPF